MPMVRINLIPRAVRHAQQQRRHLKGWAAIASLSLTVALICLTLDWFEHARAVELHRQHDDLQVRLSVTGAELKEVAAEGDALFSQITRAKALQSKRAWSSMFTLIASCMPADGWLVSVATDPATPASSQARSRKDEKATEPPTQRAITIDAPRKLRIVGYAADAAQPHEIVTRLKESGIFARVSLEQAQREPMLDGSYYRFNMVCEW